MITHLIRKELLDNLLSFRFFITLLLCIVLIPLGIYVSLKEYQNYLADYQQSMALYRESMEGTKDALEVEAKGLRPPSPFSIFAGGLDRFLPSEIVTNRKKGMMLNNNQSLDSPLSILFGKIDLLFNVAVVMSLLAILFTFDAVTREKEQKTLSLTLANSIPRHKILLGKYLGNLFTLLIPFTISLLIGIVILSISGVMPLFEAGSLLPLIVIFGISLLFISALFNLGLLVSSLTHRSLTSQIVLLFLWVLLIFAMPRVSGMVAEIVYPVKTQQTIEMEKALVRKNIEDEKATALKEIFLQSQDSNLDDAAQTYHEARQPIVDKLNDKENDLLEAVDREYRSKKNSQLRIATLLSRLSPLSALTYALTELSNTGISEMENLFNAASQFNNSVKEEVYSRGYRDDIHGVGMRMSFGWIKFNEIPQFRWGTASLAQALQACWADIVLLVIFNLLFFVGAYVGFLRYDVR